MSTTHYLHPSFLPASSAATSAAAAAGGDATWSRHSLESYSFGLPSSSSSSSNVNDAELNQLDNSSSHPSVLARARSQSHEFLLLRAGSARGAKRTCLAPLSSSSSSTSMSTGGAGNSLENVFHDSPLPMIGLLGEEGGEGEELMGMEMESMSLASSTALPIGAGAGAGARALRRAGGATTTAAAGSSNSSSPTESDRSGGSGRSTYSSGRSSTSSSSSSSSSSMMSSSIFSVASSSGSTVASSTATLLEEEDGGEWPVKVTTSTVPGIEIQSPSKVDLSLPSSSLDEDEDPVNTTKTKAEEPPRLPVIKGQDISPSSSSDDDDDVEDEEQEGRPAAAAAAAARYQKEENLEDDDGGRLAWLLSVGPSSSSVGLEEKPAAAASAGEDGQVVEGGMSTRRSTVDVMESTAPAPDAAMGQQQKMGKLENLVRAETGLQNAALLDISEKAILTIWARKGAKTIHAPDRSIVPVRWFLREILRRSRTSCSTLHLALFYLHRYRRSIQAAIERQEASEVEFRQLEQLRRRAEARGFPSPPPSPTSSTHHQYQHPVDERRFQRLLADQTAPALCARRTFLAALVVASKYLQDKNYSNKAWSKISGLPLHEINSNEHAFLELIHWNLHMPFNIYQRWTIRLDRLAVDMAAERAREAALKQAMGMSIVGGAGGAGGPMPFSLGGAAAAAEQPARYGLARSQTEYGPAEPEKNLAASSPPLLSSTPPMDDASPAALLCPYNNPTAAFAALREQHRSRSMADLVSLPTLTTPACHQQQQMEQEQERHIRALPARRGVPGSAHPVASTSSHLVVLVVVAPTFSSRLSTDLEV